MPVINGITIWEAFGSRELVSHPGTATTLQALYNLQGSDDEQDLADVLDQYAPATWTNPNGGSLQRYRTQVKQMGRRNWRGEAEYTDPSSVKLLLPGPTGSYEYGFVSSFGGETTNVKISDSRLGYPTATVPNRYGMINAKRSGGKLVEVAGVDIPSGGMKDVYTFHPDDSFVTIAYRVMLARLCNPPKTNNAPWKGYATDELLYIGGSASKRSNEDWTIELTVLPRENRTGISFTLTTGVVSVDKTGHQYLEVIYEEGVDATANKPIALPTEIWVHTLFQQCDFSLFGIGT